MSYFSPSALGLLWLMNHDPGGLLSSHSLAQILALEGPTGPSVYSQCRFSDLFSAQYSSFCTLKDLETWRIGKKITSPLPAPYFDLTLISHPVLAQSCTWGYFCPAVTHYTIL
ncbi:hypothetical protein ARMGADRAFT_484304 [Armillaria gallica]|uniref:Uncharacterized protein n=1 Tax=Armillaria gallica TaxID=47427 RepID=A0A2H3DYI8_ARMGA|nr:hypothetical protein ARMGADRAFT_484304 [Armillaria gallica]